MKDPTARTEWALSYCAECHRNTHFCRIEGHTFRCVGCGIVVKEIRDLDRTRDGLLE